MSVTKNVTNKQEKEAKPAAMVQDSSLPSVKEGAQPVKPQTAFEQGTNCVAVPATPTKAESIKPYHNAQDGMASDTSSVLSQQQANNSSMGSLPLCEQSMHARKSAPGLMGDETAPAELLEQKKLRTRRRRASNPVRPMPSPFADPEVQRQSPPPEPVRAGQVRSNNTSFTNTTTNPTTSNRYARWSNTATGHPDASAPNSITARGAPPTSAPQTPNRGSNQPTNDWQSHTSQAHHQTAHPIQGVAVVSMAKPPVAPRPQGTPMRTEGMSRRVPGTQAAANSKYGYPEHDAQGSGTVPAEKSRFNWLFCGLCMAR